MSPDLLSEVDDHLLQPRLEEKPVAVVAEGMLPPVYRRFDVDECVLDGWLSHKMAAAAEKKSLEEAGVASGRKVAEKDGKNAPALGQSARLNVPADCGGGGGLPPYDPVVNYLSPRPRFLFYDPKQSEGLRPKVFLHSEGVEKGAEQFAVKLAAEVAVAGGEKVAEPESVNISFLAEFAVKTGGCLPSYDPDVNYLSPRPRFLYYDPKRAERWRQELDFETSSESDDSISEQSVDDIDVDGVDECSQFVQQEEKSVENGAERLGAEQSVVKLAAEVAVAGGAEKKSVNIGFPADSACKSGGCLPPYDPDVNYLSPRPRFLYYDPKRAERWRQELDFETSSESDDSISEQSLHDTDDDGVDESSQLIQQEEKSVENGAERSSTEQVEVKRDEKRA